MLHDGECAAPLFAIEETRLPSEARAQSPAVEESLSIRNVRLPALLLAEFCDVRGVMPSVPLVEEQQPIYATLAMLRVHKEPCEMFRFQRTPQAVPATVQRVQQGLGSFDRRRFGVVQFGP